MNINDVFEELLKINSQVSKLLKDTGYEDYQELCVDYKKSNPDECELANELSAVMYKLSDATCKLNYLSRPVKGEAVLHKGVNGRYACELFELTCGCGIEAMVYDVSNERYCWVLTSVEAMNGEYYLVGYKDVPMEGLKVRYR